MIKIQDFTAYYRAVKEKMIAISKLPHSDCFGHVFYNDDAGYIYIDCVTDVSEPEPVEKICYNTGFWNYKLREEEYAIFCVPLAIFDEPLEYFEQLFREKHELKKKLNQ